MGPFRINTRLSQGEREWLDGRRYAKEYAIPARAGRARIATQRITGVDERYRVVASLAEQGWLFADSTNSIDVQPSCTYAREYLLAVLNSKIIQWRFKLTSTNNNVGTNELEAIPFRSIDTSSPRRSGRLTGPAIRVE